MSAPRYGDEERGWLGDWWEDQKLTLCFVRRWWWLFLLFLLVLTGVEMSCRVHIESEPRNTQPEMPK